MNLLVCGGAGFVGSHFVKYILNKYPDYKVVNFDKLTYAGNLDNLKEIENNENYTFVKGDICDMQALANAVKENKIDVIINYAAETHVDRSIMDPTAFLKTDVFGVYNLLEITKKFNLQKMIEISTDEVFGSIENGKFSETSAFAPNSPYAAAKAGGDLLCRSYWVTYQTPVVVTHSCNFYGPNQYPEKLIPLFVTNLLEGKKVPVYGDGKNVREWIFVDDHCEAVDSILHKAEPGSVYNIGTGNEITNIEITKLILKYMEVGEEMIEYVKDRPGHDKRYALEVGKIKEDLGWEAKVDFEEGLKKTVQWYKENTEWWQKLKDGSYMEYYKKQYKQL